MKIELEKHDSMFAQFYISEANNTPPYCRISCGDLFSYLDKNEQIFLNENQQIPYLSLEKDNNDKNALITLIIHHGGLILAYPFSEQDILNIIIEKNNLRMKDIINKTVNNEKSS